MDDSRRTLNVAGLVNARDLGGLPLIRGGTTPRSVFFRADNVDQITVEGWRQLSDAGIRTVVDLRQPGERQRDRNTRPDWLVTEHIDLDGLENEVFWADYWENGLVGTALYFLPHLTAMPERTGAVLTSLAQAGDGGVLFHCMGGRDRTGMVALVLLSIVGVEPEAIVDDYLQTVRLGNVRAPSANRNDYEAGLEELLACYGTTTERAFRDALTDLDLDAFLGAADVSDATVEALRTWRGLIPWRPSAVSTTTSLQDVQVQAVGGEILGSVRRQGPDQIWTIASLCGHV